MYLIWGNGFRDFRWWKDRSFTKWEASRDLYEIAYRAVNENRTERYASVKEFL